ncbi:MAG: hypothetical protein M3524_06085 [Actinomycetota bacterium]|nr:hypothetical protein [Actinomycetota bacterium]
MFKRLFFGMIGLGAGVALGVYAVRKVEAAQRRLRPEALASAAAARAEGTRSRLSLAIDQGRAAAATKEAELRAVYLVHPPPDAG